MSIKVIAHRGACANAPQNTLPAFEKAIELGSDGFETDVHLTCDGHPVICHDYNIDETSNGKGTITKMTLEEFKSYDFGSYFNEDFKDTKGPTLEEFLTLCEKNDQAKVLNIEIKPSLEDDMTIVKKTIDAVKEHGLFDRLLISSFSTKMLLEAKKIDSRCKTAFLYSPKDTIFIKVSLSAARFAKSLKLSALHPYFLTVTHRYVAKAHQLGIKVNVWTVNKEKDIRRMIKCGVDGIITDYPEKVKAILEEMNT